MENKVIMAVGDLVYFCTFYGVIEEIRQPDGIGRIAMWARWNRDKEKAIELFKKQKDCLTYLNGGNFKIIKKNLALEQENEA